MTFRKIINTIHLWLGLISGAIVFLVCLTGTIYVFREEIERVIDQDKYIVRHQTEDSIQSAEVLLQSIEKRYRGKVGSFTIYEDKNRPYAVSVQNGMDDWEGTTYYLNPYNGQVLGTDATGTSVFFKWIISMHRDLLIPGRAGHIVVGIATLIFVVLSLTGLVLWLPRRLKNLKQGLTVKWGASWKRLNHDLHNTLGFYAFPVLLMMGLTALCWSFEWYSDGISKLIGTEVWGDYYLPPDHSIKPDKFSPRMPIDTFINKSSKTFAYPGDIQIMMPGDATATLTIEKVKSGFFELASTDKIIMDQYTGSTIKVKRFSEKSLNEKIASLLKPLHIGYLTGTSSKIVYFLACLIATSLPVSGSLIWYGKLRKKGKSTLV